MPLHYLVSAVCWCTIGGFEGSTAALHWMRGADSGAVVVSLVVFWVVLRLFCFPCLLEVLILLDVLAFCVVLWVEDMS